MAKSLNKRLISLLCIVGICFTLIIMPSVSAENNTALEKAKVLYNLGIITDSPEEFCAKEGITRAEIVRLMVEMSGMKDAGIEMRVPVYFIDVADDSEYAEDINTALTLGIIHGNGDYTFSPDDYVTYPAMVKMAVLLLGYEVLAVRAGGYPNGYLKVAADLKLGSFAAGAGNDRVSGSVVAEFLYEMLDAEVAGISSNDEVIEYTANTGKTLLTEKLDMDFAEGIVTGTETTDLFGEATLGKDCVSIDGKTYIYKGDKRELIGRKVEAYFSKAGTDNEFEIKYIRLSDDNEILVIDAEDIVDYSGSSYKYLDKNGREKSADVYNGAAIIFNGHALDSPDFDMTKLNPLEGTVTLINNNGGGNFNVLVVNSYYNLVVDAVNTYDLKIYDAYSVSRTLELKSQSTEYDYEIYDENGKLTDITSIAPNDVLTVEKSDKNTFSIRRSRRTVTGFVNSVNFDDKLVTIDEDVYPVSESFITSGEKFFEAGDNGTFLLDIYGNIAGLKKERSRDYQIGMVTRFGITEGVENLPNIKIVTILGEEQQFEFAKFVNVDGVSFKNLDIETLADSEIIAAVRQGVEGENPVLLADKPDAQMIRYKLNEEKKVSDIDTSYVNTAKEDKDSTFRRNLKYDAGDNLFYKRESLNFGGKEIITSDTLTFIVNLPLSGNVEDDYIITSGSYFADNEYYDIESFCYTPGKIGADVIVLYRDYSGGLSAENGTIFFVDKTGLTLDSDDNVIQQVSGYYNKNYVSYGVKTTAILDAPLEEGDLIRITKNNKNEITAAKHIYSARTNTITEVNADFDKSLRIISGYLYNNHENQIVLAKGTNFDNIEDTSTHNKFNLASDAVIYIYDRTDKRESVRLGSNSEFLSYLKYGIDCSKMIVRTSFGGVKTVLIIK